MRQSRDEEGVMASLARGKFLNGARYLSSLKIFSSLTSLVCNASAQDLQKLKWHPTLIDRFCKERSLFNSEKEVHLLEHAGVSIVTFNDDKYPPLLRECADAPFALFYRGTLPEVSWEGVSIVGTRRCTPYGSQVATRLSQEIARKGFVVVSGLAYGIDAASHKAALSVRGRTFAILAGGCDEESLYPREHRLLARDIISSGGVIFSEYACGVGVEKYQFPQRNRIIAGMTRGTVVVEAPLRSGALITARHALEYQREVMAVPGNVTSSQSQGCHALLAEGALLVTSGEDIIQQFAHLSVESFAVHNDTVYDGEKPFVPKASAPHEEHIYSSLSLTPVHIDTICSSTHLDTSVVNSTLVLLEMKGLVKNIGNMQYIRVS